jgi:hypothetical protein
MTGIRAGAIIIAIVSGSYALVALLAGPPLGFGFALALCGASWIAADFIDFLGWTADRERAARGRAVPAARRHRDYGSCHVVFVGAGQCPPRPTPRSSSGLAGSRA